MNAATFRRGFPAGTVPVLTILAVLASFAWNSALPARTDEDCLSCHSDSTLTMEKKGRTVSLTVDPAALRRSTHKDLSCADCHEGFNAEELPHRSRIAPINCMACHSDAAGTHLFHSSMSKASGTDGDPGTSCKQCHGTHEVASPAAPGSKFHVSKLAASCGECHGDLAVQFAGSEHGKALVSGAVGAPDCLSCHANPITGARATGTTAELKLAQERICLTCHLDNPDVRARMGPNAGFIAAYEKSVHGAALAGGNGDAATCIDCHGSHEMKKGMDPDARVSKAHIPETCSACHAEAASQYAGSAHAVAVSRGNLDAPVCTDCHGEHNILHHTDPKAPVAAANVSAQVCSPCHSSVKLSEKYGISSDRFRTFADSYHGLAYRGGSVQVANCASCHGSHDIRPSSDPASRVSKASLAATCGECHPGANERFAVGQVHVAMTQQDEPILYWIATLYVILIVVTIGGMLAHNLLDFLRKSIRKLRIRRGLEKEVAVGHALYLRMTVNERIQHFLLLLSFTLLVVTGFMLSYPEAWWVAGIRKLSPDIFDLRSLLHRVSAVVMTAASLWHVGYVTLTRRGRRLVVDLWFGLGDLRDMAAVLKYNLGLSAVRPAFARFSYVEKSEYWALVWGTLVMAATGFVMWFENVSIGVITKLGWDIARTVHFYEAWLATLAILVWHIYYVIFNPDSYPMNLAWLTGHLTEEEMAGEHALELEQIKARRREKESGSDRRAG